MAKNSNSSLFQLKKIKENELQNSEQKIHTINLYSPLKYDLNQIDGLKDYFNSRINFIGASYEFAKEAKLRDDFSFEDNAATQEKLSKWLKINPKAKEIRGTEFGVLTTKVVESISF